MRGIHVGVVEVDVGMGVVGHRGKTQVSQWRMWRMRIVVSAVGKRIVGSVWRTQPPPNALCMRSGPPVGWLWMLGRLLVWPTGGHS